MAQQEKEDEKWTLFPTCACLAVGTSSNEDVGIPECTGTKTINASEKFELPIPMQSSGSATSRHHLTWCFTLNAKDVYFSVEFQATGSQAKEVVSDKQLYLASRGLVEASVPIHRSGVFFLKWDNTYSYFTSKTVNYRIGLRKEDLSLPTSWDIKIHGWVYLPRINSVKRRVTVTLFKKLLGIEDTHESAAKFEDRLRMFLTRDSPNKKMLVELPPLNPSDPTQRAEVVTTPSGKILCNFSLTEAEARKYAIQKSPGRLVVPVRITCPGEADKELLGEIPLLDRVGVSVISDVDDTIKQSDVTLGKRKVLENIFLKDCEAVQGMPGLYRHWESLGATFHYVSNSPWQLSDMLNHFMERHNLPKGTFHLKSFSLNDHTRSALLQPPEISKRAAIYQLLKDYPTRKFILVGDSGEKDPEIYADTARQFPDQVLFIFIRKILAPQVLPDGSLTTNAPLPRKESKGKDSLNEDFNPDNEDLSDNEDLNPEDIPNEQENQEIDTLYSDIVKTEIDLSASELGADQPTVRSRSTSQSSEQSQSQSQQPPQSPSQPPSPAEQKPKVYVDPLPRIREVFKEVDADRWMLFEDPWEVQTSQFFTQMIRSVIER